MVSGDERLRNTAILLVLQEVVHMGGGYILSRDIEHTQVIELLAKYSGYSLLCTIHTYISSIEIRTATEIVAFVKLLSVYGSIVSLKNSVPQGQAVSPLVKLCVRLNFLVDIEQ